MKMRMLFATALFIALATVTQAADAPATAPATAPAGKTLYHVVSFKYKETATPDQIKVVDAAFAALKTKIPGITSLNYGDNISKEKHEHGFTQCFVLTFATAKDRDVYLAHPDHKAFGKLLQPILVDVMVVDFWAKE